MAHSFERVKLLHWTDPEESSFDDFFWLVKTCLSDMHIAIAIRVRDQMLGCASLISGILRPAKECCPLIIAGGSSSVTRKAPVDTWGMALPSGVPQTSELIPLIDAAAPVLFSRLSRTLKSHPGR